MCGLHLPLHTLLLAYGFFRKLRVASERGTSRMHNRVALYLLLLHLILGYVHFLPKDRLLATLCFVIKDLGSFSTYILALVFFCCFAQMLPGRPGTKGRALLLSSPFFHHAPMQHGPSYHDLSPRFEESGNLQLSEARPLGMAHVQESRGSPTHWCLCAFQLIKHKHSHN